MKSEPKNSRRLKKKKERKERERERESNFAEKGISIQY